MKIRIAILSSVMFFSVNVRSEEPAVEGKVDKSKEEQLADVTVNGIKNPELKPYRVMLAGLDAFDEHHKLAPDAALKFRLKKRADLNSFQSNWGDVSMRIAGNETSIPVPIAADGTFVLPRSKEAYDEEADLLLNQKKSLIGFIPHVRTPGVPENARRLGDLRLECQVAMGIGKKELGFALRAAISAFALGGNWCAISYGHYGFGLPDWAINATLVNGGKSKAIASYGYGFDAPIQDKSLPDDALITFEFWSEASVQRKQEVFAQTLTLSSSVDKWKTGFALHQDGNGMHSVEVPLKPGTWEFRVKSKDNGQINLGYASKNAELTPESDHILQWQGHNLKLNVTQAGTYLFQLNVQNPDVPVFKVARAE